jgi:hypothetical protein
MAIAASAALSSHRRHGALTAPKLTCVNKKAESLPILDFPVPAGDRRGAGIGS